MRAINAQEILKNINILCSHGNILVGATRVCRRCLLSHRRTIIVIVMVIALGDIEFSVATVVRCMRINYFQVVISASVTMEISFTYINSMQ